MDWRRFSRCRPITSGARAPIEEGRSAAAAATGAAIFHGATLGRGSEVRVNGVVHLKTSLPPGSTVPIGWVAVGDPAQIFPPDQHDRIWEIQKPLNFPLTVYGLDRSEADMAKITRRVAEALAGHRDDKVVAP